MDQRRLHPSRLSTPPSRLAHARISGLARLAPGCGSAPRIARLRRRAPQPRDVLRLGPPDRSPRTAGTPAPRRPAARPPGSLASDGGDPSPATSCGSVPRIARLRRRGPQPRDVLRLALQPYANLTTSGASGPTCPPTSPSGRDP